MTSAQVADALGVSLRTLGRLVDAGEISFVMQLPGLRGARLFSRSEVERVLSEGHKQAS